MQKEVRRSVRWVAYSLMVLIGLAVLALGAEAYLRTQPRYARSHFAFDERTIWTLRPQHVGKKQWGDDHFTFRFNQQGFRGPDWSLAKAANTVRIMVLGDSYTAGLDVRYQELYTTLLDSFLNNGLSNPHYEILNAGTPAWGTDQEWLFWEHVGKYYQPDYLLLMVSPNDVREAYVKKLVTLQPDRTVIAHPVDYPPSARRGWWWANRSALYQWWQRDVQDTRHGHFWDIYKHYPVHYAEATVDNWDTPLFLKAPFPAAAESRVLFRRLISTLHASARAQQCQLLLSIIPTQMEFDSTLADTSLYRPGLIADLVAEVAAAEQIPYLNLYEQLRQQSDALDLFLAEDFHMNERGNLYLAQALLPFLRTELAVPRVEAQ